MSHLQSGGLEDARPLLFGHCCQRSEFIEFILINPVRGKKELVVCLVDIVFFMENELNLVKPVKRQYLVSVFLFVFIFVFLTINVFLFICICIWWFAW